MAERDGKMRFSFRSNITISLVNSGNRPSALLGMYLVFPLGFDRDCTAVPGTDSDVLGAGGLFGSLYGFNANYHRYSSAATSLAPGAISIIDGTFVIEEAFREKADLGRDKPLCLMFNALDHEGKLFRTTISAGTFKIFENTSGYNISSSLRSAINLMPRR